MIQIAPDVYMLEDVGSAPAFLLVSGGELALIDTGMIGKAPKIISQIEDKGYAVPDVQTIVLTHCHCDHTGNVAELSRLSEARVLAHQEEIPYVKQERTLPATASLRRVLFWLFDRIYKTHISEVDIALRDGEIVDILGGLEVIHVPGHTPGSIALYQAERQILFCGDALINEKGIQLPPSAFSGDEVQAEKSARKLTVRPVKIACFGHGEPILEQAGERIKAAIGQ